MAHNCHAQLGDRTGLRVAITGNMGSGKSTLARMLQQCGAALVDADDLARDLLATDTALQQHLAQTFGADLLGSDGLQRDRLAQRAFATPAARKQLDALVRWPLENRIWAAIDSAAATCDVVLFDAPLLYEWGIAALFDVVIVVTCGTDQALKRLQQRGADVEQAQRRRSSQWAAADQAAMADIVIDNDGDLPQLQLAAVTIWQQLQQQLHGRSERQE